MNVAGEEWLTEEKVLGIVVKLMHAPRTERRAEAPTSSPTRNEARFQTFRAASRNPEGFELEGRSQDLQLPPPSTSSSLLYSDVGFNKLVGRRHQQGQCSDVLTGKPL
jgi:hypothetical protein